MRLALSDMSKRTNRPDLGTGAPLPSDARTGRPVVGLMPSSAAGRADHGVSGARGPQSVGGAAGRGGGGRRRRTEVDVEVGGVDGRGLENLLVDLEGVGLVKGRVAREHLVAEHTKRPPVHRLAVPLRENDLWREVLWRAAERPRAVLHL